MLGRGTQPLDGHGIGPSRGKFGPRPGDIQFADIAFREAALHQLQGFLTQLHGGREDFRFSIEPPQRKVVLRYIGLQRKLD